jgi:Ca2+-binding EF-hand superfamily protein
MGEDRMSGIRTTGRWNLEALLIAGVVAGATASAAARAGEATTGRPLERLFQRMDANGDGVVTADEAQAFEQRLFARLDANHDGVLTLDEFTARRAGRQAATDRPQNPERSRSRRIAAADTNGDGRVTADELPPPSTSGCRRSTRMATAA